MSLLAFMFLVIRTLCFLLGFFKRIVASIQPMVLSRGAVNRRTHVSAAFSVGRVLWSVGSSGEYCRRPSSFWSIGERMLAQPSSSVALLASRLQWGVLSSFRPSSFWLIGGHMLASPSPSVEFFGQ